MKNPAWQIPRSLDAIASDVKLKELSLEWIRHTTPLRYSYNFTWLGCPIIQFPQDIVAIQELIWNVKPDVVIETGIAHGGSLLLSSSILQLIGNGGRVIGVDVEIRSHNREAILKHPLSKNITMIEGSSIEQRTVDRVRKEVGKAESVMVILDSNHTHDHVLEELRQYSSLVNQGSYLIVLDTIVEDLPGHYPNRPWGVGNNPKTAVHEFLKTTDRFEIDRELENRLILTTAPDGYLKCKGK